MEVIKCSKCKLDKDINSFRKDRAKKNGKRSVCRKCDMVTQAKYRQRPDIIERYKARDKIRYPSKMMMDRYKKYGITENEFNERLLQQLNKCPICLFEFQGKNICVDHCHKTKRIRGLLCKRCNLMIGNALDNIYILQRGIEYLIRNQ